ncbi:MAG: TrmH family RNA methyltransferase [Candidatus Omnitrophota bacterium]
MIVRLQSRTNPRVKALVKHKEAYFVFEGEKLVLDILHRGIAIDILMVNESKEPSFRVPDNARVQETWLASESVMEKVSGLKETPDFIAVLKLEEKPLPFQELKVVIALDRIQDPANVGTVFRCAAAFGVEAIALTGESVAFNNTKLLRAAQNSLLDIRFARFGSVAQLIEEAKKHNPDIRIYLTSSHDVETAISPREIGSPCIIVFGNEGKGVDEALFQHYPCVAIRQSDKVESLNVGVSACIIMHELQQFFGSEQIPK